MKRLTPRWIGALLLTLAVVDTSSLAFAESRVDALAEGNWDASVVGHSVAFGRPSPFEILGGSYQWKWAAGCQSANESLPFGHPYLWTPEGKEFPIDEFVGQSPSGRYAAIIEKGRLVIFDAANDGRLDLTSLGAKFDDGSDTEWPRTSVAFSYGHFAIFRREQPDASELVALDLESRKLAIFYRMRAEIRQFWFDKEGRHLIVTSGVRSAHTKHASPAVNHAGWVLMSCHLPHWRAASHRLETGSEIIRVPFTQLEDTFEREELIEYGPRGCVADSRVVLAHSSMGGYIVGFPSQSIATCMGGGSLLGPMQWVASSEPPTELNCKRQQRRGWLRSKRKPGGYPDQEVGLNILAGLWHFDLDRLNQAFSHRGYRPSSSRHVVYGLEGYGPIGQRLRFSGGFFIANSKNITVFENPSEMSDIISGGFSLSVAYSWLRSGSFRLMPELGTKLLLTDIQFAKRAPPLALPSDIDWSSGTHYQSLAWLLDAGVRLEVGLFRLRGGYENPIHLTFGSYLGWEQQIASSDWRIYDDTGNEPRYYLSEPRLNHSGPLGFLYLGARFEQF
jgi:hypothetical protein